MSLLEQFDQAYLEAIKARNMERVGILRLLKSALKNEAIKLGGANTTLTDEQAMAVLNREAKQRRDSIEQYMAGDRPDLAETERAELTLIESYLPQALSDEALQAQVDAVIAATGATQKSEMGKVMAALKEQIANPADISRAAQIISQKLG